MVLLEAGNVAPADGRLVEVMSLRVEEAALTGESEPVEKQNAALPGTPAVETPIGDRINMAFMGTVVTYGRGTLVVTATGMQTELGHIAGLLQAVGNEATPLQRRLEKLGQALAMVAVVIIIVVFGMGLLTSSEVRRNLGFPAGCLGAPVAQYEYPRTLFNGHQSGRCRRAGRLAGHGDDCACARLTADVTAPCLNSQITGGRDPRFRHHDLLGQNRHAHPKSDDCDHAGCGRRATGH